MRSDCYRDAARACIHEFCHSEEASNVDTESYRVYKIQDRDTNQMENHPARVWNESTMNRRYQSFLESSSYQRFQDQSLGKMRTISREVFRQQEVCECVRDPSPQSCGWCWPKYKRIGWVHERDSRITWFESGQNWSFFAFSGGCKLATLSPQTGSLPFCSKCYSDTKKVLLCVAQITNRRNDSP